MLSSALLQRASAVPGQAFMPAFGCAWCLARTEPGGPCSLARFLFGRKPRLRRRRYAGLTGLAANSPTRLIGCALLAVYAPPFGAAPRSALESVRA